MIPEQISSLVHKIGQRTTSHRATAFESTSLDIPRVEHNSSFEVRRAQLAQFGIELTQYRGCETIYAMNEIRPLLGGGYTHIEVAEEDGTLTATAYCGTRVVELYISRPKIVERIPCFEISWRRSDMGCLTTLWNLPQHEVRRQNANTNERISSVIPASTPAPPQTLETILRGFGNLFTVQS